MTVFAATDIRMNWQPDGALQSVEIERNGKTEKHRLRTPVLTIILADDEGNIASFTATRDAFTAIIAGLREIKCND